MSGEVTAIGGLSYKILGSIKSGVKHFIYPKENKKDFDDFMKKYKDYEELHDIHFYSIQHVKEALELLLDIEKDGDVKEKSE
jgi:predicted ATP-dependent protease